MNRALTWNYGGGTQSVAIAVLIARGRLPAPECVVIADTGREASETWHYTDRHVRPLLAPLGVTIEVAPHDLARLDLYDANGVPLIPAFTADGAGQLRTYCSAEWKRDVAARFYRSKGYGPTRPITTWIGISLDEKRRAKPSRTDWQRLRYPLLFDVPLTRGECRDLVRSHGLPDPPKSSCWMCPFRQDAQWRHLKEQWPDDWRRAVELDEEIRAADTRGGLYLHHSGQPLAEVDLTAQPDAQTELPLFAGMAGCDSGSCWV